MEGRESSLSRVDLNLLKAFHALVVERSVTVAARRLCVSQPAMSKTLQRLRIVFDDPLFVSTRTGLVPTPKALELAPPIAAALSQLAEAIFAQPFDPATANTEVRIQIAESVSMAIIPALYARLRRLAPNLRLVVDDVTDQHLELLALGESDFSIYVEQDYGSDFLSLPIGTCRSVCWMRTGHPLSAMDCVPMADVLGYPLIILSYYDRGSQTTSTDHNAVRIRRFYQDYQLEKIATLRTAQLHIALTALRFSDSLMLGAASSFHLQDDSLGLMTKPIEADDKAEVTVHLVQHKRTENSPLHSWMREQILQSWSAMGW